MTNLKLTRRERMSALIGMLIGDGSTWKHKTSAKYCLSICHSKKQEQYLGMKRDILQTIFHYPLKIYQENAKCQSGMFPAVRLRTRGHRIFNVLRKRMYKDGKRVITRELLERLTPLGLAIWYMDNGNHNELFKCNGSIRQRSIRLAVCAYTPEEVKTIQDFFLERWGIKWNINTRRGKCPILRAGATEGSKFCEIVAPFVLPSMRYKLLREYHVEQRGAS